MKFGTIKEEKTIMTFQNLRFRASDQDLEVKNGSHEFSKLVTKYVLKIQIMHDMSKPLCIVATKRKIIQYTIYCRCLNACSAHVHTLKRNHAKSRYIYIYIYE